MQLELPSPNRLPAIEEADSEMWLGEMRLVDRRPIDSAEKAALLKEHRNMRLLLLLGRPSRLSEFRLWS